MEYILGIITGILLSCLAVFVGFQLKNSDNFQDIIKGKPKSKKLKGKIFEKKTDLDNIIEENKKGIKIL